MEREKAGRGGGVRNAADQSSPARPGPARCIYSSTVLGIPPSPVGYKTLLDIGMQTRLGQGQEVDGGWWRRGRRHLMTPANLRAGW